MICVVQRVLSASVVVGEEIVGQIGRGMLVLAAVQKDDTANDVAWTSAKLASLRIFQSGDKKFELDVRQIGGGILLVSNFTVAAATRHGRRPSLDGAAAPEIGRGMFDELVRVTRATGIPVETGRYGADMQVRLVNDGPVTFLVDSTQAR